MKDGTSKVGGRGLNRRKFMGGSAAALAFTIVPSYVLGGPGNTPPSEKLNIAGIGVGGRARGICMSAAARISLRCAMWMIGGRRIRIRRIRMRRSIVISGGCWMQKRRISMR